jgi:predicted O-methyltransferase YrrM
VLNNPELKSLLDELHRHSDAQTEVMRQHFASRFKDGQPTEPIDLGAGEDKRFVADMLVALDRDKALLCYAICRSLNAKRVVEAGTSFGVSTLYLASALRDNARADGVERTLIATEYEPEKVRAARANFLRAGLSDFIELREGDLRQTLRDVSGPIDFMLIDIWIPMARPALELVAPHLRQGAIVICDNTGNLRDAYGEYFAFLNDPKNGFLTMTLPYDGGLELSVRVRT